MLKRNGLFSLFSAIAGCVTLMATGTEATARQPSAQGASPARDVTIVPTQSAVLLSGIEQEYQGWNNCGPAALKMVLDYYGQDDTQQEIAAYTRPHPSDSNVSAEELVAYASHIGMMGIARENGTLDRLKLLLSNGFPVILEVGLSRNDTGGWIGHDVLIAGYDDAGAHFVVMDPLTGPQQKLAQDVLDAGWQALNRRYVLVYPGEKEAVARAILGNDMNDEAMYTNALARARAEIAANPQDAFAYFNLGTNLNGLRQYQEAATAFDRAREIGLPRRMMWYQFGPYVAYLLSGRNADVISLANTNLRATAALEEAHYYKGLALSALGQADKARAELRAALRYNKNDLDAQRALERLTTTG
jgi:hypothetical protein